MWGGRVVVNEHVKEMGEGGGLVRSGRRGGNNPFPVNLPDKPAPKGVFRGFRIWVSCP